MAETNYYPEVGTEGPAAETEPTTMPPESEPAEEEMPEAEEEKTEGVGDTFVVSKEALGGQNITPGQVLSVKAVHVYDDEVEFSLNTESTKPMSADEEIDSMEKA